MARLTIPVLLLADMVHGASFVSRAGAKLVLEGSTFKFGGANIYWLGLDENGAPGVAYPTPFRRSTPRRKWGSG